MIKNEKLVDVIIDKKNLTMQPIYEYRDEFGNLYRRTYPVFSMGFSSYYMLGYNINILSDRCDEIKYYDKNGRELETVSCYQSIKDELIEAAPAKEMTIKEIEKKLGHPIKIVKEK